MSKHQINQKKIHKKSLESVLAVIVW